MNFYFILFECEKIWHPDKRLLMKQFSNLDSILWKYFLKNFKLGKCISQEKVIF